MRPNIEAYCKKYGTSKKVAEFWVAHDRCEICGRWAEHPHHIRTRGAGGDDEWQNLLALCAEHHQEIHYMGSSSFGEAYGISEKILAAFDRPRWRNWDTQEHIREANSWTGS